MTRALIIVTLATSCFTANPADGTLRCDSQGACPDGYKCIANRCWHDGNGPDLSVAPDGSTDLPAPVDQSIRSDLVSSGDLASTPGPSCASLAANCGALGNDNCCSSPIVIGGTFDRSYDVATDNMFPDQTNPATVSDFRLDKYEATVGRFRKFVNAGLGTQSNPPSPLAGANPNTFGSGWDSAWDTSLTANTTALIAALKCDATYQTWTDSPGANDNRPINCITPYEAFAFCAWDGGFLPTEAEWNYSASGGNEQRAYPWSNPPSSLTIDNTYAVYNCGGTTCTSIANIALVGSTSPKGDGKWGQSDLAGNIDEWVLDWNGSYANPCIDCANLTVATGHMMRGSSFNGMAFTARTSYRGVDSPMRWKEVGVRCARAK